MKEAVEELRDMVWRVGFWGSVTSHIWRSEGALERENWTGALALRCALARKRSEPVERSRGDWTVRAR